MKIARAEKAKSREAVLERQAKVEVETKMQKLRHTANHPAAQGQASGQQAH